MLLNILIVDDSNTTRSIIHKILKIGKFELAEVFEAENGKQGLDLLYRHPIHLVLLDIKMPVMNGLEMAKEMKANIKFAEIPVILITSDGTNSLQDEAERLGLFHFIQKPFEHNDLKRMVENVVKEMEN